MNTANAYPEFKDFLLGLKTTLGDRRFLLMLDEADLIPERHLGDLLPGYLRSLMQEPKYPTLLLFCGTHRLKNFEFGLFFDSVQYRAISDRELYE